MDFVLFLETFVQLDTSMRWGRAPVGRTALLSPHLGYCT